MAAIFQIRRGTSDISSSIIDGELYLHKGKGSLQVSLGDANPITLARLDQPNSGSLRLGGDITASSAYFSGDVSISGNLYLGNQSSDNISALGVFTTNLVPNGNIDLGTTIAKWDNAYINNLRAGNGVISGSSQILATLPTGTVSGSSQVLGGTGIVSGSSQIVGILSSLNEVSSSLISKTGSYATTGSNSFVGNQSINGNLYLTGSLIPSGNFVYDLGSSTNGFGDVYLSSSTVYMNNNAIFGTTDVVPVNVGDYLQGGIVYYVDTVNGFSYIVNKDDIGVVDSSNFTRVAGANSSVLGGGITNTNAITASTGGQQNPAKLCSDFSGSGYTDWYLPSTAELGQIATNTNLMAASLAGVRYVRYWSSTADANASKTYYAGDDNRNDNIGYYSVPDQNTSLGYVKAVRRTNITEIIRTLSFPNFNFSGSIQVAGTVDGIAIGAFVTQSNERLTNLESSSINLNSFTASNSNTSLNLFSASLNTFTASNSNTSLNLFSASLNTFTASNGNTSLNSYTQSLKAAITASGTDVTINGNLTVKGTTTQIDSTTINIGDNIIELNYGGSQTTSGIITRDATGTSTTSGSLIWDSANGADLWKAGKLGSEAKILTDGMGVISGSGQLGNYETTGRGIVSGSSQVTPLLPTGIVSGSIQVLGGTGIVSGSSQITYTGISSIPAGIVSGSSQITYGNISSIPIGIVSGSSQVTPLLPTGIVSGSIQVLGSSTIHSGSTGDYQFNTIGVGVAPSSLYKGNFYGKVILQSGINNASGSQGLIFAYPGLTNTLTHSIWSGHDASVQNFNKLDFYIAKTDGTQKNVLSLRSSQPTVIGLETGLGLDVNGNLNVTGSINSSTITIVSGSGQVVGILSSLNTYTGSNDTTNTTQNTRLTRIEESTSSLNTFSASMNAFYNQFTASAVGFSASIDDRVDKLEYTASYGSAATIAGQFGALQTVTASLMLATGSLQNHTASANNRLSRLEESTASLNAFTSSENTKSETLRLYTASVDAKFTTLQSLTASNLNRLSRIEESTASLNLFTSSIVTAYEGRATAAKTIFSGSSQVSYVGLSNIPSGIISSSAQIDTLFNIDGIVSGSSQINFTQLSGISANIISASSDTSNVDMIITGGSISANLYGGVVSGSSQLVGILSSLNEFSASENSKSATLATFTSSLATTYEGRATAAKTIFSGSSQVNFTQLSGISNGIVSSSAQITPLLPSGVLSGSNQTNITSINQNLGTSTTGVQFASLGIGTAPDATYELKIQGDVAASGDIVAYYTSDKRLKDNIQPIQNALDKVNELGGYTFDWNEELQKARKGHDIGVIAQEVQSTFPEVVVERDNGYLGVDYQKLVPVLIEAIKELSAKVKELENK